MCRPSRCRDPSRAWRPCRAASARDARTGRAPCCARRWRWVELRKCPSVAPLPYLAPTFGALPALLAAHGGFLLSKVELAYVLVLYQLGAFALEHDTAGF